MWQTDLNCIVFVPTDIHIMEVKISIYIGGFSKLTITNRSAIPIESLKNQCDLFTFNMLSFCNEFNLTWNNVSIQNKNILPEQKNRTVCVHFFVCLFVCVAMTIQTNSFYLYYLFLLTILMLMMRLKTVDFDMISISTFRFESVFSPIVCYIFVCIIRWYNNNRRW